MKKYFFIITFIALLLLCSCDSTNANNTIEGTSTFDSDNGFTAPESDEALSLQSSNEFPPDETCRTPAEETTDTNTEPVNIETIPEETVIQPPQPIIIEDYRIFYGITDQASAEKSVVINSVAQLQYLLDNKVNGNVKDFYFTESLNDMCKKYDDTFFETNSLFFRSTLLEGNRILGSNLFISGNEECFQLIYDYDWTDMYKTFSEVYSPFMLVEMPKCDFVNEKTKFHSSPLPWHAKFWFENKWYGSTQLIYSERFDTDELERIGQLPQFKAMLKYIIEEMEYMLIENNSTFVIDHLDEYIEIYNKYCK